jgi:hypothetical protein
MSTTPAHHAQSTADACSARCRRPKWRHSFVRGKRGLPQDSFCGPSTHAALMVLETMRIDTSMKAMLATLSGVAQS